MVWICNNGFVVFDSKIHVHLLRIVLFFCFGVFFSVGQSRRPDVVNIGAIFTLRTINGRVAQIAMNAAVADINSDSTILGGSRLSLSIHDSNYSGFSSIIGGLQYMETDTVAIIGPQASGIAHTLSLLSNELHVPMLSFTALDPRLVSLQYPYFIQTSPNDMFQMAALADVVRYFNFREVITLYTDDEHSRGSILALNQKLAERRCKISYRAVLPPVDLPSRDEIRKELVRVSLMESRVIIVNTLAVVGTQVFDIAHELGMMDRGYVWIATAWLSTILDSTHVSRKFAKSIQGVLTIRPHIPDSDRKKAFESRWNKLSNGSVGLNPYGCYAYDTVWIVANAMKAFLDSGHTISFTNDSNLGGSQGGTLNFGALSIFDEGDELLANILSTNMTGVTGKISFTPDRSVSRPSFEILSVVGNRYEKIGYWCNYSGLSVLPSEILYGKPPNRSIASQQLGQVVWPGQTTVKPRGWVFPQNLRKLRIGVPFRVSYTGLVEKDPKTNEIHGFSVDVFLAAIKLLPYEVPHEFVLFGDGQKNPNYGDLVNNVASGNFDAAVGDIALVPNRTKIADFTQPYIDSGLVVVVPITRLNSSPWIFLRPFTPWMWIVTFVFFLIVGIVVWLLEHRVNNEFRGPPKKQLITILWFSFSTMFFAHRENTVSTLGRMVLFFWLFVVLIITSSYTASFTSILTVQQLSPSISGIESLIPTNERIGYQVGSFAENYLFEELNIAKSRLVALGSAEEYADALNRGRVDAIVDEQPYVDLFLSEYCMFQIVGQEFTKSGWGFAFRRDSPLATDISTAILTLSDSGELQEIRDKYLNTRACGRTSDDPEHLQLRSFTGLFTVCGFACFVALLLHFCKMTRKFKRFSNEEESEEPSSHGTTRLAQMQRFFSFVDKKEDECKYKLKRKRNEMRSKSNIVFSLNRRRRSRPGPQSEAQNGGTVTNGVQILEQVHQ